MLSPLNNGDGNVNGTKNDDANGRTISTRKECEKEEKGEWTE